MEINIFAIFFSLFVLRDNKLNANNVTAQKAFLTVVENICLAGTLWPTTDIWLLHNKGRGWMPDLQFYTVEEGEGRR